MRSGKQVSFNDSGNSVVPFDPEDPPMAVRKVEVGDQLGDAPRRSTLKPQQEWKFSKGKGGKKGKGKGKHGGGRQKGKKGKGKSKGGGRK